MPALPIAPRCWRLCRPPAQRYRFGRCGAYAVAGRVTERQIYAIPSQLQSRPGCEELHRAAAGEPRPELCAGLTKELAEHLSRGGDRLHQVGEVLAVLDQRVGVAEPFDDDALRLVVVEVGVVLWRPGVLGADDLHALHGQALERLDVAVLELEPDDCVKLSRSHGCSPPYRAAPSAAPTQGRSRRRVLDIQGTTDYSSE